jgi:hypothetical protein
MEKWYMSSNILPSTNVRNDMKIVLFSQNLVKVLIRAPSAPISLHMPSPITYRKTNILEGNEILRCCDKHALKFRHYKCRTSQSTTYHIHRTLPQQQNTLQYKYTIINALEIIQYI